MNAADLIIIAVVGLLSAMGLKLGFLKPASGLGGLILGVILAVQHSGQVAALLVDYIEAETLRRIAAFGSILVATVVTTRMTVALTKKVLSALVLGWVDHLAGAIGAESCADLKGLANKLLGPQIFGKVEELLGIEPERPAEETGGSRAGSPEDL